MPKNRWRKELEERRNMKAAAREKKRRIAARMRGEDPDFSEIMSDFAEHLRQVQNGFVHFNSNNTKYTFQGISQSWTALGAGAAGIISSTNTIISAASSAQAIAAFEAFTTPEPASEFESIPVIAHRYAGLKLVDCRPAFRRLREVKFVPLNGDFGLFGIDSDAECKRVLSDHDAPAWGCVCGFYAMPTGALSEYDRRRGHAILEVELSGKIICHDKGYRAEHQRVLEVLVPNCACNRPADMALFSPSDHSSKEFVCKSHAKTLLVEEWIEEIMPQFYEKKQASLADALAILGIDYHDGIAVSLQQLSQMAGVKFTRYPEYK